MDRREFFKKPLIGTVATVLLLAAGSMAADSVPSVTVLVAYHSVSGNTEKMAQAVSEGAKAVSGTKVVLKRVGDVATDDSLSSDAVVVGYMSGEVKTFFDNWLLKFGVFREFKMRNKVGGAFTTGAAVSNGKELTMISILEAMLVNQMIVIGGGGAFGASASTGPDSPGIDDKELADARDLGKRVAEVASIIKSGTKSRPVHFYLTDRALWSAMVGFTPPPPG